MKRLLTTAVAIMAFAVSANAVTITFDSALPDTFLNAPYTEGIFRMTVDNGHYDFVPPPGAISLQVDNASTIPATLVPSKVTFRRIDAGTFNLDNFLVIIADPGGLVTSSNGGSLALSSTGVLNFVGAQWTNITSFSVAVNSSTTPQTVRIDTINVTPTPEPTALILLSVGGIGLVTLSRNRRRRA